MNYNYEETKENKSLNNNKYIKNNIIINDYILLKKSYSELRNDYLSNKRNTDNILSQKNKSENELSLMIKSFLYFTFYIFIIYDNLKLRFIIVYIYILRENYTKNSN